MKFKRSNTARIWCCGLVLAVLAIVGAGLEKRRQTNAPDADEEAFAVTGFGRDAGALKGEGKRNPRPEADYPIHRLPESLRRIIREFETRSLFMESHYGFTNEEQQAAMEDCRATVDKLTADEVSSLIEFYSDPATRKLPVSGDELVGPMLYEHWGKIDGERAAAWMDARIKSSIERSPDAVDLTDPFGMDPRVSDLLGAFTGWASADAANALSAWEQMHADLYLAGGSVLNLSELDARVRGAIEAAAREKQK